MYPPPEVVRRNDAKVNRFLDGDAIGASVAGMAVD